MHSIIIPCVCVSEPNQIASEVLQYMWLGISGFHFHVAYFPVKAAVAGQIYSTMWKVVDALSEWEFKVSKAIPK